MEERWVLIQGFPNYILSNYGEVVSEKSRRLIKASRTKQGALKVGLVLDGDQYTMSLKVLVATHFVEGETQIFNTPIQLDNNQENVRADNLVWRPRWFAWKYKRQFEDIHRWLYQTKYIDLETGAEYATMFDIATVNGLLCRDVEKGIITHQPIFPTWQEFRYFKDMG